LEEYRERVLRVLVYIQQHLNESLDLETLARLAHFSPCHFHRIFRGMVGEGLHEHVRRLRLERAAARLAMTAHPITRLAFEAGFETHESFTRGFRTMFGVTPSAYRAEHRRTRLLGPTATGVHWTLEGESVVFDPLKPGDFIMTITIETLTPRRVAFVRHVGPYNSPTMHGAWKRLCTWAGRKQLLEPGTVCLGLSHDDPAITPAEKIRYDACLCVPDRVEPEGEIGIQDVGQGEYAKAIHYGPYERLSETYAMICGQWGPTSGRDFRGAPSIEIYRNDPNTTPPEELVTEVYVPLE
jgi:AraC family transcriptional regulator